MPWALALDSVRHRVDDLETNDLDDTICFLVRHRVDDLENDD